MTQDQIKTSIADINKALASQYTPPAFVPKLEAKRKELQGLLTDSKRIDKKITAKATPPAKKTELKAEKKTVTTKATAVKADVKELLANLKTQVANFNTGRSKKALENDKKHKANKPGKHTSAAGNEYWENRPNRTDFSPEMNLAVGGHLGETTLKLFGDTMPVLKVGDKVTFDTEKIPLFEAETKSEDRNIRAYNRMVMANVNEVGTVKELGPSLGLTTVDYSEGWTVPMPTKYLVLLSEEDFAKGGRLKSALIRDRKYTSQEEWEKDYDRKGDTAYYSKYLRGGKMIDITTADGDNNYLVGINFQDSKGNPQSQLVKVTASTHDDAINQAEAEIKTKHNPIKIAGGDVELYASGGRIKSALMRDRKYTSQQEWEKHYQRRGKTAVYKNYKEYGGPIDNDFYKNHTAAQLWDAWNEKQRVHFLEDHHNDNFNDVDFTNINLPYNKLSSAVQYAIDVHRRQGQYQAGGSIPFEPGNNINVFGYQTQNFDICPLAGQNITEARERINKDSNGILFKEHSDALRNLAESVDEILGLRKKVFVQPLSEQDIDELTTNIGMAAIYNYKIGMICDISCLKHSLSEIIKLG